MPRARLVQAVVRTWFSRRVLYRAFKGVCGHAHGLRALLLTRTGCANSAFCVAPSPGWEVEYVRDCGFRDSNNTLLRARQGWKAAAADDSVRVSTFDWRCRRRLCLSGLCGNLRESLDQQLVWSAINALKACSSFKWCQREVFIIICYQKTI